MDLPARTGSATGLHILLVDPAFQDASSPGPSRGFDMAARFIAAGHRVSVIATAAANPVAPRDNLTVRLVRGVKRRGWHPETGGRFARRAFAEMWRVGDVDAAIVVAEPWGLALAGRLYAWVRAIPLIVDARRLPPEPDAGKSPHLRDWIARSVRWLALKLARRTVVASPAIAAALAREGLVEAKRLLLPPGCDPALMSLAPGRDNAVLRETPELAGRPTLVWAGSFDRGRDLAALVDLAAALQQSAPACLVMCGDGPTRPEIIRAIHARGLPESALRTLDPVPRARMADLLDAATVVLALPGRDDTAADFFDGLAAGKPVIFLGDGWQRSLLESRGAGFGVGLADPAAAREIADILRNPDGLRRAGQQAAALAAGRFALDRLAGELRATIEAMAAAAPRRETIRRRTLIAKRIFDVAVAGATLVALSPAILVFALLAAIKLGWPPIVAQSRIGLRGHTFRLFKFRTLTEAEDPSGALLPEAERATPFGRFLRRTALDELPTLLNVIAGDMSLVGPRAHPADYAAFYTPAQRRRHEVRPGLTGWAQVDDSPDRTWEQRFARDLEYVDRLSLGLDARILARTALILLRGRRLAPAGQPPIPRFDEIMARREGAEDA